MPRNYNISKKEGELWTCEVTDSYGNVSTNYFETSEECMKNVYFIWDNEDNKVDSEELLSNAIQECVEIDKEKGREPSLD
jgi:hypothetical protein